MPPVNKPLKNDGPACRVCGCTEHNACVDPQPTSIACSWVETSGNDVPRELCSACSGTAADMAEVIDRGMNMLLRSVSLRSAEIVVGMARAAKVRYGARQKAENWD